MTDDLKNPIPFSPRTMTVEQLTECTETLRQAFDGILREDVGNENIIFHLTEAMKYFNRNWNK